MNQNFTAEQLIKFCKQSEYLEYKIKKDDLLRKLDTASLSIVEGTFEFTIKKIHNYYYSEELVDIIILRKLNDNLKRLYKDEQSNRRIIISQVKTLLEDICDIHILRTDVSSFYESINRKILVDKLKGDSMLSYFSITLLEKLLNHPLLVHLPGLPRGIALSSTLSEIYMRKFDKWIRTVSHVYYYARFVDDIIIFSNKKSVIEQINENFNLNLEKGLMKNENKTRTFDGCDIAGTKPLEYLGYKFVAKIVKRKKELHISIADNKINKIKTRIIHSFRDYIFNSDFTLLVERLKFLSGNYSIKSSLDGTDLKAGIYFNYCYVTDLSVFDSLDLFCRKVISCKKNSLGAKLNAKLDKVKKKKLLRYSFKAGFENKIHHSFKPSEMKKIKRCWE